MSETDQPKPAAQNKVKVVDAAGRIFTIRKLTALDQFKLIELAGADNVLNSVWLGWARMACCITALNETPLLFPRTKAEINANVDLLGDAGLDVVFKGYREHFVPEEVVDMEAVKNSSEQAEG